MLPRLLARSWPELIRQVPSNDQIVHLIALLPRQKGVYNPRAFILHAASLGQGFPHCQSLSTAASRRSLGRISVPVWLTILSDQLPIVALVVRYTAN